MQNKIQIQLAKHNAMRAAVWGSEAKPPLAGPCKIRSNQIERNMQILICSIMDEPIQIQIRFNVADLAQLQYVKSAKLIYSRRNHKHKQNFKKIHVYEVANSRNMERHTLT